MEKQPMQEKEYEELFRSYQRNKNKPLKTLIYLYQGNLGKLWISIFFFIFKHSPIWIIPIITANIINITSQPAKHRPAELWINLAVAFVVIIQNIPTHIWHVKYFSLAVRYVEAGLRSTLVRKLQQLSISYHKELKSGKLQSKVIRDVEAVEFLSRQFSATILPVIFNILVAFAVTISKSVTVALFFLMTIPVSVILVIFFRKNIQQTNNEFRKEIEEMSAKVSEMVEMIPVTRAHGLENLEIKKIDHQLERVKERGFHLDMITAFFGASSWVTFQAFQLFCLAFTGYLAYQGKITVGDVVLYQGYFSSILGQISGLINIYPNIVKGFESVNSIGEILLAHDIEDHRGKKKLKKIAGNYSFQNVEFRYHSQEEPVLKELNLDIKAGECIALVGESGAGKTTILNLVIGFCRPSRGQILLDGVNVNEIDLNNYRKFLAVVPQNTILFSGSIRENITYGLPSVGEEKINQVIESANLRDFLDKLPQGVDTIIGEHGGKLSGGQRQRIAIARALIRDPQIIVLDEATSALDSISEAQVQKAMKNLIQGRTTFIVAHRFSTIRDADRIAVIKDGTCVELGTYEELMKEQGQFYQLETLQA